MSAAPDISSSQRTERSGTKSAGVLTVSAFDRTATLIIASLVTVGAAVGCLALVFFANKFPSRPTAIALAPMEATSPTGNGGFGTAPEPPGVPDAPELSEPQLGETLDALMSVDMLSAVATSDAVVSDRTIAAAGEAAGRGNGLGDARQPGPGNDGVIERVPRWERWKIRFEPQSEADFAAWLDQYEIRVGVLGRDNLVHVAWNFVGGNPTVEAKPPSDYAAMGQTIPSDGPMPALTRQLAQQAGIMPLGRIALLFYPMQVESLLWTLEKERNKSGDANKIRETVFTVTKDASGYNFAVVDQKYF
ncbi:MAG TPA: hypothetical protein VEQ85_01545 [Lacipirellulaceae bacterium]|nr:hypothetical protein [Lacipirellulaceae bacterium]